MSHLWEVEHPYYCNESNYFSRDCMLQYQSWKEFFEAEGDSDMDMNLLFRWDWGKDNVLSLFWMEQRKGRFRTSIVHNMNPENEPEVRAWLGKHFQHLLQLWEPLTT